MKTIARWTVFTAATTLAWLVGGALYLVLSRHYATLQISTLMLGSICLMAGATAIAAIAYAAKIDEDEDPDEARMAARRARPAPRGRPQP